MLHRPEHPPGHPAPATGLYRLLNVFGAGTATSAYVIAGQATPDGAQRSHLRLEREDGPLSADASIEEPRSPPPHLLPTEIQEIRENCGFFLPSIAGVQGRALTCLLGVGRTSTLVTLGEAVPHRVDLGSGPRTARASHRLPRNARSVPGCSVTTLPPLAICTRSPVSRYDSAAKPVGQQHVVPRQLDVVVMMVPYCSCTTVVPLIRCFTGISTSFTNTEWSGDSSTSRTGTRSANAPARTRTGQTEVGFGWRAQSILPIDQIQITSASSPRTQRT